MRQVCRPPGTLGCPYEEWCPPPPSPSLLLLCPSSFLLVRLRERETNGGLLAQPLFRCRSKLAFGGWGRRVKAKGSPNALENPCCYVVAHFAVEEALQENAAAVGRSVEPHSRGGGSQSAVRHGPSRGRLDAARGKVCKGKIDELDQGAARSQARCTRR